MAPGTGNRRSGGSVTLERGLRLLRILDEHQEGLSVSELAKEMSTHRAGIYRLLGPLAQERLVRRRPDNRYVLGTGLVELAARVRGQLLDAAVPILQQLADELRATTALTVRDGDEAVVAAVLEPRNTDMHIAYRAGLRHRLDQAAPGIAILASLPAVKGERKAISQARRRGWAVSTAELLPGATGVGVALEGADTDASISAVWTGDRDDSEIAARVAAAAERIDLALSDRS